MDLATLAAAAQLQAALVLAVGVVGWVATGLGRRRELIRQEAGRLTAAAARRAADGRTVRIARSCCRARDRAPPTAGRRARLPLLRQPCRRTRCQVTLARSQNHAQPPPQAPPVTVVLPIRGCRPHSRANWSSQLNTSYGEGACSAAAACTAWKPSCLRLSRALKRQVAGHCLWRANHTQMQIMRSQRALPRTTPQAAPYASSLSSTQKQTQQCQ